MFSNPNGATGTSGSGATGRGTGGGSGNKDKDKDDKKNKTSYDTSPHPHTNFMTAKPVVADVPSEKPERKNTKLITSTADESTNPKSGSSDSDLANDDEARNSDNDNSDRGNSNDDKDSTAKNSKARSSDLPPLFRSPGNSDGSLKWLGIDETNPAAPGGNQSDKTDSSASGAAEKGGKDRLAGNGSGETGPYGKTPTPPSSFGMPAANPATHPIKNPALTKYDYETMFERGRALSTLNPRTSFAPTQQLSTPSAESEALAPPMPHGIKDPISSIGPGTESRTMYGPSGMSSGMNAGYTSGMPTGPLNSEIDSGLSRGSGSYISNSTLPQMPHFDYHLPKPNAQSPLQDGAARSYDPNRGY
jgi:hypothetical protein